MHPNKLHVVLCCCDDPSGTSARGGSRTRTPKVGTSPSGWRGCRFTTRASVPETGVEPARPSGHRALNPTRLPFRHSGKIIVEHPVGFEPT